MDAEIAKEARQGQKERDRDRDRGRDRVSVSVSVSVRHTERCGGSIPVSLLVCIISLSQFKYGRRGVAVVGRVLSLSTTFLGSACDVR